MPKENEVGGSFGGWRWEHDTTNQNTVIISPDGKKPYSLPGLGNAEALGFIIAMFLTSWGERRRALDDVRTAINHSTIPPEIRQQIFALMPQG